MAIFDSTGPRPATAPLPFPRLYRCHISAESHGTERTVFVEAASHQAAIRKIANAVAAIEMSDPDSVKERIYNCYSAQELVKEGLSEDHDIRLFETGWSGSKATCFVETPLFLTTTPALIRKWAQIAEVSHDRRD